MASNPKCLWVSKNYLFLPSGLAITMLSHELFFPVVENKVKANHFHATFGRHYTTNIWASMMLHCETIKLQLHFFMQCYQALEGGQRLEVSSHNWVKTLCCPALCCKAVIPTQVQQSCRACAHREGKRKAKTCTETGMLPFSSQKLHIK